MKQTCAALTIILLITLLGSACAPQPAAAADDLIIYGDARAPGWDDWSWDPDVVWDSATQVHSGAAAVMITYKTNDAGFSVRTASPINPAGYTAIAFWVYDAV